MNVIPLITTIVSTVFVVLLIRQFKDRRKIHQLVWTIAMSFYAITAFAEFLMNPELLGINESIFRLYYVLAAPLVGLLGAGVLFLLVQKKIANGYLLITIILSFLLVITGSSTPLDQSIFLSSFNSGLGLALRDATKAFPMSVRIYSIILNSVGGMILILGALYSYIKDRSRYYNIFLFLGALMPSLGGFFFGILENPDVFLEFELLGTIFLFIGFYLSDIYVRKTQHDD